MEINSFAEKTAKAALEATELLIQATIKGTAPEAKNWAEAAKALSEAAKAAVEAGKAATKA